MRRTIEADRDRINMFNNGELRGRFRFESGKRIYPEDEIESNVSLRDKANKNIQNLKSASQSTSLKTIIDKSGSSYFLLDDCIQSALHRNQSYDTIFINLIRISKVYIVRLKEINNISVVKKIEKFCKSNIIDTCASILGYILYIKYIKECKGFKIDIDFNRLTEDNIFIEHILNTKKDVNKIKIIITYMLKDIPDDICEEFKNLKL